MLKRNSKKMKDADKPDREADRKDRHSDRDRDRDDKDRDRAPTVGGRVVPRPATAVHFGKSTG